MIISFPKNEMENKSTQSITNFYSIKSNLIRKQKDTNLKVIKSKIVNAFTLNLSVFRPFD